MKHGMIDASYAQQMFGEAIQQALNPFTLAACVVAAFFGWRTFLGVTALCALATLAFHTLASIPDAGVASAAAVAGQGAFGRLLVAPVVMAIVTGVWVLIFGVPGADEAAAPEPQAGPAPLESPARPDEASPEGLPRASVPVAPPAGAVALAVTPPAASPADPSATQ